MRTPLTPLLCQLRSAQSLEPFQLFSRVLWAPLASVVTTLLFCARTSSLVLAVPYFLLRTLALASAVRWASLAGAVFLSGKLLLAALRGRQIPRRNDVTAFAAACVVVFLVMSVAGRCAGTCCGARSHPTHPPSRRAVLRTLWTSHQSLSALFFRTPAPTSACPPHLLLPDGCLAAMGAWPERHCGYWHGSRTWCRLWWDLQPRWWVFGRGP
jgi:hypothetical protein